MEEESVPAESGEESEVVEMMEIAEEVVAEEADVSVAGMEMELGMMYEEVVQEEEPCVELLPDDTGTIILEGDNDKENSDHADAEFPEDVMEITRRRISQDAEGNCYCGKDRNLNIVELLCASCNRWYHESCIGYQLGKLVPFMSNYVFMCKNCSPTGLESFKRSQAQLPQMLETVLANLTQASIKNGTNQTIFSKDSDIIPYLEMHWDSLTTRRTTSSLHSTSVTRALQKEVGTIFKMEEKPAEPGCPYFGLMSSDLTTTLTSIAPKYESMIKTGHLKVSDPGAMQRRGAKRRNAMEGITLSQGSIAKKTRGGDQFPGHGYPSDHPFNKDNFRYWLAEPDVNAPYRQEFDESNDWAKPIPGWLYRVLVPCSVLLALHDRAPQLKISDDRLSVTGDKGYSMVRATHGVNRGSWYFETKIVDMPDGGATRVGWGQANANLQGPLGYDRFGYSYRSRYGTAFHEAKGKSYSKGGYGLNDVIGLLIIIPDAVVKIPESFKDKPLVRFKSHLYYEEKDTVKDEPKSSIGSKIIYFKNGVCQGAAYENITEGTYYPSISVFRNTSVRTNFGPEPWIKPQTNLEFQMMSEKAELAIVEQTLSDLVFLTENDGKLSLDNPMPITQN